MGLVNTSQRGTEDKAGAGGLLGGGISRDTGPLASQKGGDSRRLSSSQESDREGQQGLDSRWSGQD